MICFINFISEIKTFSVLPILRFKYPGESYRTVTISKAIKVTRFTSRNLLASKLLESIIKSIQVYELEGTDIGLFLMDRPWLDLKDFNTDITTLTKALDSQIETDVYSWSKISELNELNKIRKLKEYKYKNNFMNNYGEPILNKKNNLIGYKLNGSEYATVNTYYNDENLLCNKISIQEFDDVSQTLVSLKNNEMITWIDIKKEFGFVRELDNVRYFYDKNNILFNVEIRYNQPKFPVYKQDSKIENKIGTIDFETHGNNLRWAHHEVYAAGFAIKGKTQLLYIETGETNNEFVNRFFDNILTQNNLDGYTIYVHNLGRFDSIFILKALITNKDITLIPEWKENSILSITIKYLDKKNNNIRFSSINSR